MFLHHLGVFSYLVIVRFFWELVMVQVTVKQNISYDDKLLMHSSTRDVSSSCENMI